MSVSILIISHYEVGNALVNAAKATFNTELPLSVSSVEIQSDADPDVLLPELKRLSKEIDQGDGVLILTDLFGSTPSNIAHGIKECSQCEIVTGLNLPMLLRVLNYPDLNLKEINNKAKTGGQEGIISSENAEDE